MMFERVFVLIGVYLDVIPPAVLLFVPFWGQFRVSKRIYWGCISLYMLYLTGTAILSNDRWIWQLYTYSTMLIGFILFFVIIKARLSKMIYVFFVVSTYTLNLGSFVNYCKYSFFPEGFNHYGSPYSNLIHIALLFLTMPFIWRFFCKTIKPAILNNETPAWGIMWIIPAIFLVIIFIMYDRERISSWQYLSIMIVLAFGSFLIYFVAIKMIVQTDENTKLMQTVVLIERQLKLQGNRYNMLQDHIAETKAARHDLRHHLTLLQSYINAGENEKLKAYLCEYADSLPLDTEISFCENYTVNSILCHYAGIARSENILFDMRLELPQDTDVSDSDLCIVFGNCVENAIEACRLIGEKKFIKINSKIMGKILAITVDNSFSGELKKEGDLFMSTKHEGEGIGIPSIKGVAEKYGGSAQFEAKGNVFQASVMLRILV